MMDMKAWMQALVASPRKKALPVLSFPAVQLMGIDVQQLIGDAALQAECMRRVAERVDAAASVSLMDLSVEAEAFGAPIRTSAMEVPTVVGSIVSTAEDAGALAVPQVGAARTGIYVDAIRKAAQQITDRPVLAGVIGPYSLAGRLMDVTEIMYTCYDEPETVHAVLEKVTSFLIDYCRAYAEAGANGVVMAEPLAGLLSPELSAAFSCAYVKKIVDAVQTDAFAVVYHNCGNATIPMAAEIFATGAAAYHFGNAIDLKAMLEIAPADVPVMGNVDPAGELRGGTPESVREVTLALMERCAQHSNFVVSSGCDIPPAAPWENIDAFFAAVEAFYAGV